MRIAYVSMSVRVSEENGISAMPIVADVFRTRWCCLASYMTVRRKPHNDTLLYAARLKGRVHGFTYMARAWRNNMPRSCAIFTPDAFKVLVRLCLLLQCCACTGLMPPPLADCLGRKEVSAMAGSGLRQRWTWARDICLASTHLLHLQPREYSWCSVEKKSC